jgi:amino-acid N-acetyltransferase
MQGPFTDRQLESIARGMVYLEKAGLVSVIVVEHDEMPRGHELEREAVHRETMRVVSALEAQGAKARPILGAIVRLGPKPDDHECDPSFVAPEAHTEPSDLSPIRSALRSGEIPVLPPLALDSFLRSTRVDANDVLGALARGMVEAASADALGSGQGSSSQESFDLAPLRLMIINKEGGVPSYARAGYPHLLVNLESEYKFIRDTFQEQWKATHPTALSNLALARTCLAYMPPSSSAIMVNHRAPTSLIGNLITNKPVVSSSLPHALLQGNRSLTANTPTLLRRGSPVEVIKDLRNVDRAKLTHLLEQSFGRKLDTAAFYHRLECDLDFVIVAGDYAGAAIVTRERAADARLPALTYLDKFAVLPSHQGDGTVDFLWVALHDETYGLGAPHSANPNGGKQGAGEGSDLVWRSRANNPVNKWYFERSSGHVRMGDWLLFWCDAERQLQTEQGRRGAAGLSYVEDWERGRLALWQDVVPRIASSWSK